MIRRSTWILLLLFVFALAGALFWQRYGQKNPPESTPTTDTRLLKTDPEKLSSIRIEEENGALVELKRNDSNRWVFLIPEQPIQATDAITSTVDSLTSLRVLNTLTTPLDDTVTGLDQPAYTIEVTWSDGRLQTLRVGKQTPTSSGYYVRVDDSSVYVVDQVGLQTVLDVLKIVATPTSPPGEEIPVTPGGSSSPAP